MSRPPGQCSNLPDSFTESIESLRSAKSKIHDPRVGIAEGLQTSQAGIEQVRSQNSCNLPEKQRILNGSGRSTFRASRSRKVSTL